MRNLNAERAGRDSHIIRSQTLRAFRMAQDVVMVKGFRGILGGGWFSSRAGLSVYRLGGGISDEGGR